MDDSSSVYHHLFPCVRYPRFVRSDLSVYWIAVFLRLLLTLLPQSGYIHPDEFFQSTEVVIGDIFNLENARPWEFKVSYPVRSICPIYLILGAPFYLLKTLAEFCNIDVKSPYVLIVVPRLVFCLFSFVTDFSLYRICKLEGENFRIRLLILSTSYVMLTYATRTFSNSIEMTLVSFLIYYVVALKKTTDKTIEECERLKTNLTEKNCNMRERIKIFRQIVHLPAYQYQGAFTIAILLVLGTFNRPTFLAFAVPPVFFWLYRGMGTQHVTLYHFHMRLLFLMLSALPLAFLCILADSMYYGKTSLQALLDHNLHIGYSFVVAPYNFVRYNMDSRNLSKHGVHPRITHALVNVPLLYNVLAGVAFLAVFKFFIKVMRKQWNFAYLPRVQSVQFLLYLSLLTPLLLLSIFPHQEPRFLLPITLPMVYLFSSHIYGANWGMQEQIDGSYKLSEKTKSGGVTVPGKLIRLWFLCNMSLTLMFGFLHQAGVYSMAKHFSAEVHSKVPGTHVHLVTSYTYSMPMSLLGIPSYADTLYTDKKGKKYRKAQDFFTYELGSATPRQICTKLSSLLAENERTQSEKKIRHKTYLALPGSRMNFLNHPWCSNLNQSVEGTIFPHVTLEALPQVIPHMEGQCPYVSLWENPLKMLGALLDQFKIVLIQVRSGSNNDAKKS